MGPNPTWVNLLVAALIGVMLAAMLAIGSGPLFLVAFLTIAGISLVMAIRGVLARGQPAWYRQVLLVAGVALLAASAVGGTVAFVGALLRL